jgi:hypothetical protein
MTRVVVVVTAVVAETITRWLPFASSSSAQTAGLEAASRASHWSDCEERDRAGVGGRAARTELEGGRGGHWSAHAWAVVAPSSSSTAVVRATEGGSVQRFRAQAIGAQRLHSRDSPPGGGVPQPSDLASPAAHDLSDRLVPAAGAPGPRAGRPRRQQRRGREPPRQKKLRAFARRAVVPATRLLAEASRSRANSPRPRRTTSPIAWCPRRELRAPCRPPTGSGITAFPAACSPKCPRAPNADRAKSENRF